MLEYDYERALAVSKAALAFSTANGVPPIPQFYELFYSYAAGVNPLLNARINAILRDGEFLIPSLIADLHTEFFRPSEIDARFSDVSQQINERIGAVHDAIGEALDGAQNYSVSLEHASLQLDTGAGSEALKSLAVSLLSQTREMQTVNGHLEEQLAASSKSISDLQRDLDDVRRQSMLDPLTKVLNRKSFDEGLGEAIQSATETGASLCLVLLDIDHFKRFNDQFGHQTGDQVLRLVAQTLQANIKGKDLAARYGGEEFAIILPTTDIDGATALAESIRTAIRERELLKRSTNERMGRLTASFGVALFTLGDTQNSLIDRADSCMYAAKNSGRDTIVNERQLYGMSTATT